MDTGPRTPTDLKKAFAAVPRAGTAWKDLTPVGRRDFISWIDAARQPQTRRRRIEVACSKLVSGKRRPCCYSVVPLGLYSAIADVPAAKARWKELTPMAKRDFANWIDSARETKARQQRIDRACAMLAAGRRSPV